MDILNQYIKVIIAGLETPVALLLMGFGPPFVVGWWLLRKKKRFETEMREPFTELPLRPAGESIRLEIDKLSDRFTDYVMSLAAASIGLVFAVVSAPNSQRTFIVSAVGLAALGIYVRNVPRLTRTGESLWNYRLGFAGERVVAEELNQLMADGFRVFHDIPFDGFNIDHVIVGPSGVYAVETKTKRKSAKIAGERKATIIHENDTLIFPDDYRSVRELEQARRNAATLGTWLTKATGDAIVANAILTFPGWYIHRKKVSDVNVLNPDEIKRSFPSRTVLSSQQIKRIVYQLTERCRLPKKENG